jgi:hypothetical protein
MAATGLQAGSNKRGTRNKNGKRLNMEKWKKHRISHRAVNPESNVCAMRTFMTTCDM